MAISTKTSEGAGGSSKADDSRRVRREELRRKWMEKRAAQERSKSSAKQESPLDRLIDTVLTPTYIAVGAGIIIFRKLTGKPSVTVEDFE